MPETLSCGALGIMLEVFTMSQVSLNMPKLEESGSLEQGLGAFCLDVWTEQLFAN